MCSSDLEVIETELTADEIAELQEAEAAVEVARQEAAAVRESAISKLSALGLTEEEIASLVKA